MGIISVPGVHVIPAAARAGNGRKLRACAYGRVSTEQDSQALSYATQRQYYTDFINQQAGMEFVGFYGDEAISGTNRTKRVQFNQMMEDAKAHKFDVIYTKSISRFARNTLDTLQCIRDLKALTPPVEVVFEKENLRTLDAQSELVLTIMSALAQDESRSISENIKWSIQKKFQNGDPIVDLNRMMGYDKGEDGSWVINEAQAEIIRYIYHEYANGASATSIARRLNEKGVKTVRGCVWRADAILLILRNEKYAGHLVMQKTYTQNFLDHKSVKNEGLVPKYFIENHHAAIVDLATNEIVQQRLKQKEERKAEKKLNKGVKGNHVLSNLIVIAADGKQIPLTRLTYSSSTGDGYFHYPVWKTTNLTPIPELGRPTLNEIAIEQSFMEMLYWVKKDYEAHGEECDICKAFETILAGMNTDDVDQQKLAILEEEIRKTGEARQKAVAREFEALQVMGNSDIYTELISDLGKKLEQLQAQKAEMEARDNRSQIRLAFHTFLRVLQTLTTVNAAGDPLVVNTVHTDGSFIVYADGKPRDGRMAAVNCGDFKMTQEKIDASPDLLKFNDLIYGRFITSGHVLGDVIEYSTTFGVTMRSVGNSRTLRSFLGFKRVAENGEVEFLDTTWKVNGRAVTKKKTAEDKITE